jgi:hypothetical protein
MDMSETSTWDEVQRIADEIELKVHLAGMEARDRWRALQPRLEQLERKIVQVSDRAEKAVEEELATIGTALRKLREDLTSKP